MYTSLELLERTLLKTDAEVYLGTPDPGGGGGGVLPYVAYIGMCRPIGYGF